jgi:hypothetical protein
MDKKKFIKLLQLNRLLSNELESMTKKQMATVYGGKVFSKVHKTDLKISAIAKKCKGLNTIIESGNY